MSIIDFIGVDPLTPYNPFAHDSDPEPRTFDLEGRRYQVYLQPRESPMRADLTDAQGNDITSVEGIAALLAYVAEWSDRTQLLRIRRADRTTASRAQLFEAYFNHCLNQCRSLNDYDIYIAEGLTDRVQQLDDTFKGQHVQEEEKLLMSAAKIDTLLFGGHLTPLVGEYLQWVQQGEEARSPKKPMTKEGTTDAQRITKGHKVKLNICVKNGWMVNGNGSYGRGQVNDNELAFILGVIFCGDRICGGKKQRGKDGYGRNRQFENPLALEKMFSIERLSDKRSKALRSKADYSEFYDSLK